MSQNPSSLSSSAPAGAPLRGVRVLDLTRLLPGPVCALHLADLGAEVIKIEDTGAGDYAAAALRTLVNRNTRGLALDLKQPGGVEALLRLCESADVLVERSFVQASPVAVSLIKRALAAPGHDLATLLELEANAQSLAMGTPDHRDAVQRFLRKEPASFVWPAQP